MTAVRDHLTALIPPKTFDTLEGLARRGLRLFPCKPRDKKPLLKSWQLRASSDLSTIHAWATQNPGCNWGVTTGPESNVFVLDVDGVVGRVALASLEDNMGRCR